MTAAQLSEFESRLGAASGRGGDLAVRGNEGFTFSIPGPKVEVLEALSHVRESLEVIEWEVIYDVPTATGFAYFSIPKSM